MKNAAKISHLESEAIFILREVVAQFRNPAVLFSGGKDSIVLTRLAEKAFRPDELPFPLVLIDTGHGFPEAMEYIHERVKKLNVRLVIAEVQKTIDLGLAVDETGPGASRNKIQSITLLDAIKTHGFDALVGGARRDEEKARAKERVFSLRQVSGGWDPESQRLEPWAYYNGRLQAGWHMRVFPLSNWTELDIWEFIEREELPVPSIYFSHQRKCISRGGQLFAWSEYAPLSESDQIVEKTVRCRTVGDLTSTGMIESWASSVSEIIAELKSLRTSERGGRLDDRGSDTSLEDRKRQGYF